MSFSNIVSGYTSSDLVILFIPIFSNWSPKCEEILERCFFCKINFHEILSDVSFRTPLDSERQSVSGLRVNSQLSIFFDSWRCFSLKSVSSCCCCSNFDQFIKLGLEFDLKVIIRIWIFRDNSNQLILNMFRWESIWCLFKVVSQMLQLFCCGKNGRCSRWSFSDESN